MTYTLAGSISKVKGAHTLKAGYDGRLIRVNNRESRSTSGQFSFTAGFTQGPNPNTAASNRGNSIASLLLGTGSSGSLIQSFKDAAAQSTYTAVYLQDDWRVTKKLTLNLGLRYDLDTPRTERYDRMNYFDPSAPSPLASKVPGYSNLTGGLVFVGINGRPRSQYKRDNNNFAPRFGFAYQVSSNDVDPRRFRQHLRNFAPAGARHRRPVRLPHADAMVEHRGRHHAHRPALQPVPRRLPGHSGILPRSAHPGRSKYPGAGTGDAHALFHAMELQRAAQLPSAVLLEVAYVGTRGLQLSRNDEGGLSLNQLDPKYMALGSQLNQTVDNPFYGIVNSGVLATPRISRAQLLRPYPQFTDVIPLYSTGASANYHSLQVSFSRRFSHGFQFEGSYTWAKAIQEALSHVDSYNIRASRSLADYDIAHRFVASYIFELPFGRGRRLGSSWNSVTNAIAGGWQFNGFTTFQSGTPLSISANNVAGIFNSARLGQQQRHQRKAERRYPRPAAPLLRHQRILAARGIYIRQHTAEFARPARPGHPQLGSLDLQGFRAARPPEAAIPRGNVQFI